MAARTEDRLSLGIDTSNYTTSIALARASGEVVYTAGKLLEVRAGERGLRQSEALYQHVVNFPELMANIPETFDLKRDLAVICYSDRPRPLEDSYMPVFRAGIGHARALAKALDIPAMAVSHQENHIRAAIYGAGITPEELSFPLLATHFSGGTSEILLVETRSGGYNCKIVGKTLDLNAGQLVDRVGVSLGLGFPAGKALEALAQRAEGRDCVIPSTVEGMNFHFSGQENKAAQLLETGAAPEEIAYGVLRSVAKTLIKTIGRGASRFEVGDVLFSGGVMSNQIIRSIVERGLSRKRLRLHFSEPRFAADNAAGCALMGADHLRL
ncbi:MAG: peptidase M22 [Eubacterium sp.]|nr:peptidase M22 [Eubacterium sp.]